MTLGDFIIADPAKVLSHDAAKARILAAIDAARGNRTRAAEALGESYRGLLRVIDALDMWPAIDALCAERDYSVQPGPPRARSASVA